MISSPSPTRKPSDSSEQEQKKATRSMSRKRTGETPAALFVKAIFRPILKGLYYLIRGMRSHKLVTLVMILLILGSATAVNYYKTGQLPFGIGYDPFDFQINGGNGGGEKISDWLHALREGDAPTIQLLDTFISQPPDAQALVNQFSKQHFTWRTINRLSVTAESDTTIDSYWEIDLANTGPGGPVVGYLQIHFVTVASQSGDVIISVDVLPFRAAQA